MFCTLKLLLPKVCTAIPIAYSFIERKQDAGHLIPEVTSFEERLKRRRLSATIIARAK